MKLKTIIKLETSLRRLLILLPFFLSVTARAQDDDLPADGVAQAWKNIKATIELIRQDRVAALAGRVVYPLRRENLFQHEGNWSYGGGDVWFDPDGKIIAISYSSTAELRRKYSLTEKTNELLYPGIAHWERNVLVCKAGGRLVRDSLALWLSRAE